jgi:hypothetical protein
LQILRVKVPGGGPAEARRLSFRSLDVEQIGHVYEGLLDHIAVRASEMVLGLTGTREKEPEIALSILKAEEAKGEKSFLVFLHEQTDRSENALRKAWQAEPDVFDSQHLQIACNNDPQVFAQVLKYAGLVREDDFGYPTVFLTGSVYVTAGATRRATGTHYTPRSLTEPIVQHTLEPLVYIGPAEGLPKLQWKLRSPAELLDLKVCDMAMGSAGFLVQVIRYLSERLVEAWENLYLEWKGQSEGSYLQITPEGKPATGAPGETIIPRDDEERLILARRLVADRCIYGVDKNPLAVEIAKLSIWLTTMDKGRPFTFLDHALKCGDSLVGASVDDFLRWAHGWQAAEATLFDAELQKQVELAREKRRQLEAFTVREVRDAEQKAELLREAEAALARVKVGCDLLTGVRLLGLSKKEVDDLQVNLLFPYVAGKEQESEDARRALAAVRKVHAFHWEFEFPEVFEKGGFSAFLGNPPFLGGLKISTIYGENYLGFIKSAYPTSKGTADLCSLFFVQCRNNLRYKGTLGLIAVNTIAQGDTRLAGLENISQKGGNIYFADSSLPWPGVAAVHISVVHIANGEFNGKKILNDQEVEKISPFLDATSGIAQKTFDLMANQDKAFIGAYVLGLGFVLTSEFAIQLLSKNPKNSDVIFPYLNGEDINSQFDQFPSRWVINFHDWSLEKALEYSECFNIVEEQVKPEREQVRDRSANTYWWRFARTKAELFKQLRHNRRVLVAPRITKHLSFVFVQLNWVYNEKTVVFSFDDYGHFTVLQSSIHEIWARKFSSTLETRLNYTPTDCFHNFPFPVSKENLEQMGETYHEHRRQIMLTRQEGLTATYNRFHSPNEKASDIARLRELHVEMDNAVAAAYGWSDLDLGHGFHETPQGLRFTISEEARREVLARLLRLNHERYEKEVRQGLHEKKKAKASKGKKGKSVREEPGQYDMF